jgi:hypothetical protein
MAMPNWNADRDDIVAAGQALDHAGAPQSDVLLSADPAGFKYFTGRGGVMTTTDSLDVLEKIAVDYNVRWLILQRAYIVDPLIPVIEGQSRPTWIGLPVFTIPYTGRPSGDPIVDATPALAIYPVCTQPGDTRCASPTGTGTLP